MTDTKLPTEAELDAWAQIRWLTVGEKERLLELGRAYYAQRRALREIVDYCDEAEDSRTMIRGIEKVRALLGEGGS